MKTSFANEYYSALIRRDTTYDGVVFFGIKTTGIFCRSICTARKPKFENCEFFSSVQEALLAGYRPCKRCRPLHLSEESVDWIQQLIQAVEEQPERRWTDRDFLDLGVCSSTVRRQFKRRYGMTFVAYARARRMGIALKQIRQGSSVIHAQHAQGYQSASGFRDAFSKILGSAPLRFDKAALMARWIDTPLGAMLAIASDSHLQLLEFTDRRGLEREVERLRIKTGHPIVPGDNVILKGIASELEDYFTGSSSRFVTPMQFLGTPFQQLVWKELMKIEPGTVRSYSEQARAIGSATAVRAVARANGANQLAIIIPCHRVVGADGALTGYAGGLARKRWLLEHEQRHWSSSSGTGEPAA